MCSSKNRNEDPQQKFTKSVKSFLIVNVVMVFLTTKGIGVMSWWWLPAMIWGINLANTYFELRRSGDEPRFLAKDNQTYWVENPSKTKPPMKKKAWSEKDLV